MDGTGASHALVGIDWRTDRRCGGDVRRMVDGPVIQMTEGYGNRRLKEADPLIRTGERSLGSFGLWARAMFVHVDIAAASAKARAGQVASVSLAR